MPSVRSVREFEAALWSAEVKAKAQLDPDRFYHWGTVAEALRIAIRARLSGCSCSEELHYAARQENAPPSPEAVSKETADEETQPGQAGA